MAVATEKISTKATAGDMPRVNTQKAGELDLNNNNNPKKKRNRLLIGAVSTLAGLSLIIGGIYAFSGEKPQEAISEKDPNEGDENPGGYDRSSNTMIAESSETPVSSTPETNEADIMAQIAEENAEYQAMSPGEQTNYNADLIKNFIAKTPEDAISLLSEKDKIRIEMGLANAFPSGYTEPVYGVTSNKSGDGFTVALSFKATGADGIKEVYSDIPVVNYIIESCGI